MSAPKPNLWRFRLLFALPAAALVALVGRVAQLQCCDDRDLAGMARRQQRCVIPLAARPGNIFAKTAGGLVLLAGSRQAPVCYADPVMVGQERFAEVSRRLAAVLGTGQEALYRELWLRRDKRFAHLVRGLSDAQVAAFQSAKREDQKRRRPELDGVELTYEWRRHYSNGPLAAHVLGYRQVDGQACGGLESQADRWLAARDGRKVIRADAAHRGNYAFVEEYDPPRDGGHVVLTLDVVIQGFLERALAEAVSEFGKPAGAAKPTCAMGVVMDPWTGAVLAMASVPTYDPNAYQLATADQRRNRAVTDPYEPGSTFKPFIAAGAVEMQKADLNTLFNCENGTYYSQRGGVIREFKGGFGIIPLSEIVIVSSNPGMAKLGERLGNPSLHRIAAAYGFGGRTGVELPGECPGRLLPLRRWTSYDTLRMPFGQGPIMVTCLQLATAFSAIANGGVLLRPWVVDRVTGPDGQACFTGRARPVRRVLTQAVARRFIDEALVEVVRRGTGKKARLDAWEVFGKTGTGQIGGPHGYEQHEYTATFMAGAPAARPEVVCVISVYRPAFAKGYTGGSVAAPHVRNLLANVLAYRNVPSDRLAGTGLCATE